MKRSLIHKILQSEKGGVMPLIGLSLIAITCSMGLAIDIGRGQIVEAKLYNSIDTAGLAAGAKISNVNVQTEVEKFVTSNFPNGYAGATVSNVVGTVSSDGKTITVTATATLPTTFMRILGYEWMTVNATSEVTRSITGLEAVLVLDNTGSMDGSGITNLKTASKLLLDNLYGDENTVDKLFVGIVPFSQAVNIGSSRSSWLASGSLDALDWGPTSWAGCVRGRSDNSAPEYDTTNDLDTVEKFQPYYWPDDSDNDWIQTVYAMAPDVGPDYFEFARDIPNFSPMPVHHRGGGCRRRCGGGDDDDEDPTPVTVYSDGLGADIGPNKNCPREVTAMIQSKSTLKTEIDAMTAQGYTHIGLGAAWGFRMLSPSWRGKWGGEMDTNNLPVDYTEPMMNKAAVIMTDGDNRYGSNAYTAYGYRSEGNLSGYTGGDSAEGELDSRLSATCSAMKAAGINVYTVTYGTDVSTSTKTLMRNCASNIDFFFDAPSGSSLGSAFQQIGDSLSELRVSK